MTESGAAPAGRQLLVVRLEPRPPVARDGRVHGPLELPERRPLSRDELDIAAKYLKAADPLYYKCLVNRHTKKHLKKRAVRRHLLKFGYMMKDGSIYLDQTFAAGTDEERRQQEARLKAREARELEQAMLEAREERLRLARENGDVAVTPLGYYYETQPCSICMACHPVTLLTMDFSPCPGSVQNKYFYHPPSEATSMELDSEMEANSPAGTEAPCPLGSPEEAIEPAREQTKTKLEDPKCLKAIPDIEVAPPCQPEKACGLGTTLESAPSAMATAETAEMATTCTMEHSNVNDFQVCESRDVLPEASGLPAADSIDMSWLPCDCPQYDEIVALETKISAQWKFIMENLEHLDDIEESTAMYAEASSDVSSEVQSTADISYQPEKDYGLSITNGSDAAAAAPSHPENLETNETASDESTEGATAPPKPVVPAIGDEERQKQSAYRVAYEQAIESAASCKPTTANTVQRRTVSALKMAYEKAVQKHADPPKPVASGCEKKQKGSVYRAAYQEAVNRSAASSKPINAIVKVRQSFSAYRAAYEEAVKTSSAPPTPVASSCTRKGQNFSAYKATYERAASQSASPPRPMDFENTQVRRAYRSGHKKTGAATQPGVAQQLPVVSESGQMKKYLDSRAATPSKDTQAARAKVSTVADKRQKRSAYLDAYQKALTKFAVVHAESQPAAVPSSGQGLKFPARAAYEKAVADSATAVPMSVAPNTKQEQKHSSHRAAHLKAATDSTTPPKSVTLSEADKGYGKSAYLEAYEKAVAGSAVSWPQAVVSGSGHSGKFKPSCGAVSEKPTSSALSEAAVLHSCAVQSSCDGKSDSLTECT